MPTVKQKVFLISEKQREALLNYLLDRPYREVAIAVQILGKAPSTMVDVELTEEQMKQLESGIPLSPEDLKEHPIKIESSTEENGESATSNL